MMTAASEPVTAGPWSGWLRWKEPVDDTFLDTIGVSYARADGPGRAIVMLETRPQHRNRLGILHGGFLAGFADHAYFAGVVAMGMTEQIQGVTVDLSLQYLDGGQSGPPLEAQVELLHETGRMLFLRLMIVQAGRPIVSSTATVRKAPSPR